MICRKCAENMMGLYYHPNERDKAKSYCLSICNNCGALCKVKNIPNFKTRSLDEEETWILPDNYILEVESVENGLDKLELK